MQTIGAKLQIPLVQEIYIAPFEPDPEKSSKFGALVLADGTVGLTYTGLDDDLLVLQDRCKYESDSESVYQGRGLAEGSRYGRN